MKVISASLFIFVFVMSGCGGIRVADEHATGAPSPQAAVLSLTVTASEPRAQPMSSQVTEDQATSAPTPEPTNAPAATPTQTSGQQTQPITGTWRQITTADGLCTDSPILIGRGYIGTLNSTFCYPTDAPNLRAWRTDQIPAGARLIGMTPGNIGEGAYLLTSDGTCLWKPKEYTKTTDEWDCHQVITDTANPIVGGDDFHWRTPTTIGIGDKTYSIAAIVGDSNARPTWSESSSGDGHTNFQDVWVGTNGYGVIVIDRDKGVTRRFTVVDGLPSNTIRDVSVSPSPKPPMSLDIWIATDKGTARWNGKTWEVFRVVDGLPSDNVRGISANKSWNGAKWVTTVWIATDKGAAYFDGDHWVAFTAKDGLPVEDMRGVTLWGNVWFATKNHGLVLFEPG